MSYTGYTVRYSPVLGASDPITEPEVSTAPGHDKKSFCWRHRTLLTALNLALLFLALTAAGVAIYFVLYNQQADRKSKKCQWIY